MTTPMEALQLRVEALETELFALVEQIRQIGATADRNARTLDDLEDALTELATTAGTPADPDTGVPDVIAAEKPADTGLVPHIVVGDAAAPLAPTVELADLHAWVDDHIAPLVRKTTTTGEGGGVRWCRQWPHHAEAVERFSALYLAYRQLSTQEAGTWLSVYLRDHLDPHLTTLTSPYGPFHACTPRKHSTAIEPLGHHPANAPHDLGEQP